MTSIWAAHERATINLIPSNTTNPQLVSSLENEYLNDGIGAVAPPSSKETRR
jgi:hypothetical protein